MKQHKVPYVFFYTLICLLISHPMLCMEKSISDVESVYKEEAIQNISIQEYQMQAYEKNKEARFFIQRAKEYSMLSKQYAIAFRKAAIDAQSRIK